MATPQPLHTDCTTCGTVDHAGYRCPCGCHSRKRKKGPKMFKVTGIVTGEQGQVFLRLADGSLLVVRRVTSSYSACCVAHLDEVTTSAHEMKSTDFSESSLAF